MKSTKNLNETKSSYSFYLTQNRETLYRMFDDTTVSTEQYRQEILTTVEPANLTSAKRRFINTVNSKRSKEELVFYICNVMCAAEHLGASPDYRWSTEK